MLSGLVRIPVLPARLVTVYLCKPTCIETKNHPRISVIYHGDGQSSCRAHVSVAVAISLIVTD